MDQIEGDWFRNQEENNGVYIIVVLLHCKQISRGSMHHPRIEGWMFLELRVNVTH